MCLVLRGVERCWSLGGGQVGSEMECVLGSGNNAEKIEEDLRAYILLSFKIFCQSCQSCCFAVGCWLLGVWCGDKILLFESF